MNIHTRRDLFKLAPAAALAATATPALAYQAPVTEAPDMPDWWRKKLVEGANGDPMTMAIVEMCAMNTHLRRTAPEGSRLVGLQYRCNEIGGIDQEAVWVTARSDTELFHLRPGFRNDWFKGVAGRPMEGEAV